MNFLANDLFMAAARAAKGDNYSSKLDSIEHFESLIVVDKTYLLNQLSEAEQIFLNLKKNKRGKISKQRLKLIGENIDRLKFFLGDKHLPDEQFEFEDVVMTPPFLEEIYSMLEEFDDMQKAKGMHPIDVHEVTGPSFSLLKVPPPPPKIL